jgi:hypothetical protein
VLVTAAIVLLTPKTLGTKPNGHKPRRDAAS